MTQSTKPRATPNRKPSDRSRAPTFESRIASDKIYGDDRDDDQRDEEDRGRRRDGGPRLLRHIGFHVGQQVGIEVGAGDGRRDPGCDRQHLSREAAQHRQQRRDEDDRDQPEVEIRRHGFGTFIAGATGRGRALDSSALIAKPGRAVTRFAGRPHEPLVPPRRPGAERRYRQRARRCGRRRWPRERRAPHPPRPERSRRCPSARSLP